MLGPHKVPEDMLSQKAVPVTLGNTDIWGGVTLWPGHPGHCRMLSSTPALHPQTSRHPDLADVCPLGPGSTQLRTTALVFGLKPFSVLELGRQWGVPKEPPLLWERKQGAEVPPAD